MVYVYGTFCGQSRDTGYIRLDSNLRHNLLHLFTSLLCSISSRTAIPLRMAPLDDELPKRDVRQPLLFECAWEVANKGSRLKNYILAFFSANS